MTSTALQPYLELQPLAGMGSEDEQLGASQAQLCLQRLLGRLVPDQHRLLCAKPDATGSRALVPAQQQLQRVSPGQEQRRSIVACAA